MRLLLLLIFPTICFSQPLTEIKTKRQAENFIKENFRYYDYKYDLFVIDTIDSHIDNFKVGDFNHDGQNDLLVFGIAHVTVKETTYKEDEIVILIGDGKKPRKVNFPYRFFRGLGVHIIPYPKAISIEGKDFVLIKYDIIDREQTAKTFYDTLFIKNDHVIPYTENPSEEIVTKIEFKTGYCYGPCPVFEMTIDEDLNVVYNGIDHVDKKGEFRLKAEKKDWDYLVALVKNLNVHDLRDNYSVAWTDDQTAFTTFLFKNGDRKKIEDYGLNGTFGLSVLYDYFFNLSKF